MTNTDSPESDSSDGERGLTPEQRRAAIASGRRQRAQQGIPDETDDLLLLDRIARLLLGE